MAIPDLVQLCVDNYTPFFNPLGTPINICLDLKIDTWKEIVSDSGGIITPLIQYQGEAFTLNRPQIQIEVSGIIGYGDHLAHPLISDTAHVADDIDLEEAALLWNRGADLNRARLVLPILNINREYSGIIKNLTIEQKGGETFRRFKLVFTVLWNGSRPLWRGWA